VKRIGTIQHEKYEPNKLEAIFRSIEIASKGNHEQHYEIILDNLKIVPRTTDPEKFNSFSEYVTQDSEYLTVYVYYGNSKQHDTYFFYFKGVPAHKAKAHSLSGSINIDEWEKQQRDKILKELHYERLEKENDELKTKLEESEEKYSTQQQYWENIKNGKLGSYGEIGSAILISLLGNPNIKKMFPALNMLGNIAQPEQDTTLGNMPQEEATFTRKGEENKEPTTSTNNQLSEEDQNYLKFLRDVSERLNDIQLDCMINIISLLTNNPVALKSTHKHIQNFLNCKPKI
jgi:hypothetical protein